MRPVTRKIGCDADRGREGGEADNPVELSPEQWKFARANGIVKAMLDKGDLTIARQSKTAVHVENRTRNVVVIPVGMA